MVRLTNLNRRQFLGKTVQAAALAGLGDFGMLSNFQPAKGQTSQTQADKVSLGSDLEPLVRLIEDTSREKLLGEMGKKVRQGLSYQDALAALFLAGVRDIEPRPLGYKFHAVMAVYSVHAASLAAEEKDRWLPIFWALDNYKDSQQRNREQGNWYLKQIDASRLPEASAARQRFIEAMDKWQEEQADQAITCLVRDMGAQEVTELLWCYCARDFRNIGHKAIYTANALRTLQCIGWRHAETVARSLAYALLDHEGTNPADRDDKADRPWRQNLERVKKIRAGWSEGKIDSSKVGEFLVVLRNGSYADSCDSVLQYLNKEVAPTTLWDALFLRAAELLMQQPGIIAVHCATSMNALHYGFQTTGNDETRRLLLLQAAAFLPMFREAMDLSNSAHPGEDQEIDAFRPISTSPTSSDAINEIFAQVGKDNMKACRQTLAFLKDHHQPESITRQARRLLFDKADESHDYKFSSAAFEDYYHISEPWRDRYLAASMFHLRGSSAKDNEVIKQTKEVLGQDTA